MKKSTIFMIAYILILFIAPIIGAAHDTSIIAKIALAATISGIFFAIADLCYNLHKEWKKQIKFSETELQEAEALCIKMKAAFVRLIEQIDISIKKAKSLESKNEYIKIKKDTEKSKKRLQRKFFNKAGHIKFRNVPKRMSKLFYGMNVAFFSLGIGIFFLLFMFPNIIPLFEYRQEWFSIYGCAFVFLNYLITDTAQSRIDKEIKKYKKHIEEFRKMKKDLDRDYKSNEKSSISNRAFLTPSKQEDHANE